jgi:hypothetical protein
MIDPDLSAEQAAQIRRARWREDHPDWLRPARDVSRRGLNARRAFVAVDGEGGGKDRIGRQQYKLLRAGDAVLYNDDQDLTTLECLAFLSSLETNVIYVAFYFDYDVTMILRHASPKQRERVLHPIKYGLEGRGERRATYIGEYEVEYMPHKYFRCRKIGAKKWVEINECGPFFQCSFVKAITDWETGTPEERAMIRVNKLRRSEFDTIGPVEIEYNRMECRHLEELMNKFRDVCQGSGYMPSRWQGPGYLATDMFRQRGIPKRKEYGLDVEFQEYANHGYYGGRFELFKIGTVRDVREYDINSAYPYAMLSLPCLMHGAWNYRKGTPDPGALFVANVRFGHRDTAVCNLPVRDEKSGTISWPSFGGGWYWSTEIAAALRTGKTYIAEWRDYWQYDKRCDCRPFDWVKDVYAERKRIGKGTKGYVLKLGLNSLYGKCAQSIGSAPYANPCWAGLITAHCRAALIDAYSRIDPRQLVMLATDGIYTICDLPWLDCGEQLGQWESKLHREMFLVQPGVYFSSEAIERPKTRGAPMALMIEYEQIFRDHFAHWLRNPPRDMLGLITTFPSVELPLTVFVGMKLAQAWRKPFLAGKWLGTTRKIGFDFRSKREYADHDELCVHTFPKRGRPFGMSAPYGRAIGAWREEAGELAALLGDQPDLIGLTPQDQELLG